MCCPVYREVITNVRCRRAQYTLTAACTLIDKVTSIKRANKSGVLVLKTVRSDGLRTWRLEDLLCCCRRKKNEVVSNWIDFLIIYLFCVPKITRNIDRYRYRIILYSRNVLGDGIRWVGTACIVDKKNEWMHVFCLLYCFDYLLVCCDNGVILYCTIDPYSSITCLQDSDRVSGRNWWRSARNGTFNQL